MFFSEEKRKTSVWMMGKLRKKKRETRKIGGMEDRRGGRSPAS